MKKKIAVIGMLALMMGGLLVTSAEARSNCNDGHHNRGNHYGWGNRDNNNHRHPRFRQAYRSDWRDRRIAYNNRWNDRNDRDRFRDRRGWW